jgi:hypothetical protein
LFKSPQSIVKSYFSIYILVLTIISYIGSLFLLYRNKKYDYFKILFMLFVLYILGSLYIILTIPKFWNWYLNFYFIFSITGIAVLIAQIKYKYFRIFFSIIILSIIFVTNKNINQSFYTNKLLEGSITDTTFRNQMSSKFKLYDMIKNIVEKNENKEINIAYPTYYMFEEEYFYSLSRKITLNRYNYRKPESLDTEKFDIIIFNGRSNRSHSLNVIQNILTEDKKYELFIFNSTAILMKNTLDSDFNYMGLAVNNKIQNEDFNVFGEKDFSKGGLVLKQHSIIPFYLNVEQDGWYNMLIEALPFDAGNSSFFITINGKTQTPIHLKNSKKLNVETVILNERFDKGVNLVELKFREPIIIKSINFINKDAENVDKKQ